MPQNDDKPRRSRRASPKPELTAERARELLSYDAETGELRWRVTRRGTARAGSLAGSRHDGYRRIEIDGRNYRAHRVCWLITHGAWPTAELDHLNNVRDDNRLRNLREVTRAENVQNLKRAHSDSKTGVMGIYRQGDKYRARIRIDGERHHLGTFDTADEAAAHYRFFKRLLHPAWVEEDTDNNEP